MLEGLLNLSLWGYIGVTLLLTHITIAIVTIFPHRHQAHNALTLHPAVSHLFSPLALVDHWYGHQGMCGHALQASRKV